MAATFDKPELPKQDLLLKLLRLTESDTDGEALSAIRKANALLKANKWDWEKLLRGKITIIADPFAGKDAIPDPVVRRPFDSPLNASVPPRPQPSHWTPGPPPSPPPRPQSQPKPAFTATATAPRPSAAKSWVQSQKAAAKTTTRGRRSTGTADINQL